MLRTIRTMLRQRGRLSLGELALALNSDSSAVEPMMELLTEKGIVELLDGGCSGKGCAGCSCAGRESMMVYRLSGN